MALKCEKVLKCVLFEVFIVVYAESSVAGLDGFRVSESFELAGRGCVCEVNYEGG